MKEPFSEFINKQREIEFESLFYGAKICGTVLNNSALNALPSLPLSFLSPVESKILSAIKIEKRRIQWLSARLAVKFSVANYIHSYWGESLESYKISILSLSDGSPYVQMENNSHLLNISISHCKDFSIGSASVLKHGVDIEEIKHRDKRTWQRALRRAGKDFVNSAVALADNEQIGYTLAWAILESLEKCQKKFVENALEAVKRNNILEINCKNDLYIAKWIKIHDYILAFVRQKEADD